ncbi:MAG TPA: GIY-YIG nuclease family protein [Longimicrobium sp.]|nr:GIY-YIG nuclease family protein [Longimicrobium sp.]
MASDDRYYVYVMSNVSRTLYIGMTNDLVRRVWEHKQKTVPGFTATYNVTQLVYFEEAAHPQVAIAREKELKGWRRSRKRSRWFRPRTRRGATCRRTRGSSRPSGDRADVEGIRRAGAADVRDRL